MTDLAAALPRRPYRPQILTEAGFSPVRADAAFATAILDAIIDDEAEQMLFAASRGRWQAAHAASYDLARKAVHALLLAHGIRVDTGPGHHVRYVAAVEEFCRHLHALGDGAAPRIARSSATSRIARNIGECPDAPDRRSRPLDSCGPR